MTAISAQLQAESKGQVLLLQNIFSDLIESLYPDDAKDTDKARAEKTNHKQRLLCFLKYVFNKPLLDIKNKFIKIHSDYKTNRLTLPNAKRQAYALFHNAEEYELWKNEVDSWVPAYEQYSAARKTWENEQNSRHLAAFEAKLTALDDRYQKIMRNCLFVPQVISDFYAWQINFRNFNYFQLVRSCTGSPLTTNEFLFIESPKFQILKFVRKKSPHLVAQYAVCLQQYIDNVVIGRHHVKVNFKYAKNLFTSVMFIKNGAALLFWSNAEETAATGGESSINETAQRLFTLITSVCMDVALYFSLHAAFKLYEYFCVKSFSNLPDVLSPNLFKEVIDKYGVQASMDTLIAFNKSFEKDVNYSKGLRGTALSVMFRLNDLLFRALGNFSSVYAFLGQVTTCIATDLTPGGRWLSGANLDVSTDEAIVDRIRASNQGGQHAATVATLPFSSQSEFSSSINTAFLAPAVSSSAPALVSPQSISEAQHQIQVKEPTTTNSRGWFAFDFASCIRTEDMFQNEDCLGMSQ